MDTEKKNFVQTVLPWLVAAGAMVGYLATLNHWVTIISLPQVGQIAGWDWRPGSVEVAYGSPLFFLVTYPFHWLPTSWLPVTLNLFVAVCAALTLALLARSVALLPHDRTHEQREREQGEFSLLSIRAAWVPPLLATLVCGLQLSFWEHATAASGEMFDLLLFAYIIRCLLEYRVDRQESWMTRCAVVYGAAMANNWAMVGFFPAFLFAMVWVKGLSFFNLRFLLRTAVWGLAGMSVYLLLPLVHSLGADSQESFWKLLRYSLGAQKQILALLPLKLLWVLGLTSLLPVLVMGIRWASYFGDTSPMGTSMATFMFHVIHAVFLVVCLWVAFDPPFSPRLFSRQFNWELPFLTLYYLGALSVGYFSGYFLLVFGEKAPRQQRVGPFLRKINSVVTIAIWLLLIAVPVGLLCKNLPQVQATNGSALSRYGSLLTEALPAKGAVVLSDDPRRLFLLEATLDRSGKTKSYFLLNTFSLQSPRYHRFLQKKYSNQLPATLVTNRPSGVIDAPTLVRFMAGLAQDHEVYYLHPSFGYYFEQFYLRPHGLVYEMKLHPTNTTVNAPLPAADVIAANQTFWKRIDNDILAPVTRSIGTPQRKLSGFGEQVRQRAHLGREPDRHALLTGTFYSRGLNYWGVELQKAGRLEEARWCFTRAQELNPDNVVAKINQQFNENLRAGKKTSVEISKSVEDAFGRSNRSWDQALGQNGPFDEPNFCYEQGRVFAQAGLYRQAAQQFERARTLAPDNLAARLWLAQFYSSCQWPDQVLELAAEIRARPEVFPLGVTNQVQLLYIESLAYFTKTNIPAAEEILRTALDKNPNDENLLAAATQLYLINGRYTNAQATIAKHLKLAPENPTALINEAYLYIRLNDYRAAIPRLDHLLTLQTNNYDALFNRAIAHLRSDHLEEAQRDYETLQKVFPSAFQVYYGLAEIAYRRKDSPAAINYYQLYLTNSPPNTTESKFVSTRLNELKSRSP